MRNLDFNFKGDNLTELSPSEVVKVNGGGLKEWLLGYIGGKVLDAIIENRPGPFPSQEPDYSGGAVCDNV